MKKFHVWYFFFYALFLLFLGLVFWLWSPLFVKDERVAASPLPTALTIFDNAQVTTIDLWKPLIRFFQEKRTEPSLRAKSVLSYDLTTDHMLFAKTPDASVPMASLTKIMTAVISLEQYQQTDTVVVPPEALVGENSMNLGEGEKLSVNELLHGLLMVSANDSAETLATHFPGGRDAFVRAMNEKAKSLGLSHTQFPNPSGLEGDGTQTTTASDLLVLTRYALSFSVFRDIVKTVSYDIPASDSHKEYYLENEVNLLTTYPGVQGVKDGYTPEAGLCLVTYLNYKGHDIIAIILGSENRRQEMKDLLDYSLKKLNIQPPAHE